MAGGRVPRMDCAAASAPSSMAESAYPLLLSGRVKSRPERKMMRSFQRSIIFQPLETSSAIQCPMRGRSMAKIFCPILSGKKNNATNPFPFRYSSRTSSLVKGHYKLLMPSHQLYDLSKDRAEENDLSAAMPEKVSDMERELVAFFKSVEQSHAGGDYNDASYQAR